MSGCIYDTFSPCSHDCPDCPQYIATACCHRCGERFELKEIEDNNGYCNRCMAIILEEEDEEEENE